MFFSLKDSLIHRLEKLMVISVTRFLEAAAFAVGHITGSCDSF